MTLEEIVAKLNTQNFGPNQSVIASSVMHPQKGLSKLAEWFTDNVNTAAGIPSRQGDGIYAYAPSTEKQAEAGLNLAGLLQTGAFASRAAPKSAGGTLGTSISTSAMNKIIKELEASNKSTVPKIPTGNVFNNSLGEIPVDTRLKADNYFSGTNQPQQINISDIVPTQKNITLNNLKGVNNIDDPVNAVMMNGKYYLTDGHHRASLAKLNNEKSISANVFDGEKINPNLNFELLNKHLSGQKLTPEEMALYEKNGLAMETPQLQRYNLANANAQGGSPESRALDNGFSTEKYFHGTHQDIKDFKPSNTGALGKGIYSTLRPDTASIYADRLIPWEKGGMTEYGPLLSEPNGNVLPIMLNRTKTHVYDNYRDLPLEGVKPDYFINNGFDSISVKSSPTNTESETSVFDPKNIRSRFAAFDPLRKNSSSLLASGLLGSLLLNKLNTKNEGAN